MARRIIREAEEVDVKEERLYEPENNPNMDSLPADWKDRLNTLRGAPKAMEGRELKKGKLAPEVKTQYNFTDPPSSIVRESGNNGGTLRVQRSDRDGRKEPGGRDGGGHPGEPRPAAPDADG